MICLLKIVLKMEYKVSYQYHVGRILFSVAVIYMGF
jgi:hypothetical protein